MAYKKPIIYLEAYRNSVILNTIIKAVKNHKKVIAITGNGHTVAIKEVLKEELKKTFGVCTTFSIKEYIY